MIFDTIRSFLLPPIIGRYLFKRSQIGTFELTPEGIYLTLTSAYHHYREIKQARVVPLVAASESLSAFERMMQTLDGVIAELEPLDAVYIVLPSNQVVIKELTVPFIDAEKIELIAPFEVEPSLPFAIHESIITTLVMHADRSVPESKVLVCAANREYVRSIVQHLSSRAPLVGVSVAIVELAALYDAIPDYHGQAVGATLVMHAHADMTEYLLYDVQDRLVHVRVGMIGFGHPRFFDDVSLMLSQAATMVKGSIERVLIIPDTADTAAWMKKFNDTLHLNAQLMQPRFITHYPKVHAAPGVSLEGSLSDVITPALQVSRSADFNILVGDLKPDTTGMIFRQMITASALVILGLGILIGFTTVIHRRFAQELQDSQNEVRQLLIKELDLPTSSGRLPLPKLIDQAINKVRNEQDIWLSLSAEHRASLLHYLEALSRRLDIQKLGLNVTHLAINDTLQTMLFEGSVRDFDALHALQDELEHIPYFEQVPRAQDMKFSLKITLKPTLE